MADDWVEVDGELVRKSTLEYGGVYDSRDTRLQIEAEEQQSSREQERLEKLGETHELDAKIGPLEFVGDFSDPDVNVRNSRDTAEHSIINGATEFGSNSEFVVQEKGTRPTEIQIVGWIRENQLDTTDELVGENLVGVRTGRWLGTGVITDVDVDYSRVYHHHHGPIFETTIDILAIRRGELPDGFDPDLSEQGGVYIPGEDSELSNPDNKTKAQLLAEREEKKSEEERLANLGETANVSAVIGNLGFVDDFEDPDVQVSHSRETVDHELVTGHKTYRDEGIDHVVQLMGREPTEITVEGWVREDQLEDVDKLPKKSDIRFISGRWTGTVVPLDTDVEYSRNTHNHHGSIFKVTIELLGTQKDSLPDETTGEELYEETFE